MSLRGVNAPHLPRSPPPPPSLSLPLPRGSSRASLTSLPRFSALIFPQGLRPLLSPEPESVRPFSDPSAPGSEQALRAGCTRTAAHQTSATFLAAFPFCSFSPHPQARSNRAASRGRASRLGESARCAPQRFGDSVIPRDQRASGGPGRAGPGRAGHN